MQKTSAPLSAKTFKLAQAGFHFALYTSVHGLPEDWETAQPDSVFLHRPYLAAIEDNPPRAMRFSYLIFYHHDVPVGVAYCQVSNFRPDASIRETSTKDKYPCVIRAVARYLKNFVASQFDHNLLVCGNLLLTGEHGFFIPEEKVEKAAAFLMLEDALMLVQKQWESKGLNIHGIFIKDVQEQHRAPSQVLVERKFREFTFHPNMTMALDQNWQTFEDYMQAISSKYRVRAKRAFRLAEGLERRELTEHQIISNKNRLYELYKGIMGGASFNMVVLHENYMPDLKRKLGEDFKITGYYRKGELVGYYTTIRNGEELEAHFLGFEESCNRDCQLYLNILFDILRQGISERAQRIVYARTAMEIKASVGAVAEQMYCYIRANNSLMNKVLPPLLEYLRPPDDWEPRNPFK